MRLRRLALTLLLAASGPIAAQPPRPVTAPPPAPAPAPAPTPLDAIMLRWEAEMLKIQTLQANLTRTEKDLTFNTTKKYVGFAQYMKSINGLKILNQATLDMRTAENPNVQAEKFICTGTHLYSFHPEVKEVKEYKLPEPGQVAQDNVMTFLFGMKATEAQRRYKLQLAKEDQFYYYLDVTPLQPADKADFQFARIVLNKDSFLPRQLWFQQPGNKEVTWDIPAIKSGVKVDPNDFATPKLEKDWKLTKQEIQQDPPPKIIRSGGQ
jgi:TIGR03009 family protein